MKGGGICPKCPIAESANAVLQLSDKLYDKAFMYHCCECYTANVAQKDRSKAKYSILHSQVLYFVSRLILECYIFCIAQAKGSTLSGICDWI